MLYLLQPLPVRKKEGGQRCENTAPADVSDTTLLLTNNIMNSDDPVKRKSDYRELEAKSATRGFEGEQTQENQCGKYFVTTVCENGHRFAKRIFCGREWCAVCGSDNSEIHRRRIARWLPKVQQMKNIGYFVIEFPLSYRKNKDLCYSREGLRETTKKIVQVLAGYRCGRRGRVGGFFERGLLRWHFFGDKKIGSWNPHLNVVVESKYLSEDILNLIKTQLRSVLNCSDLIVHYEYVNVNSKKDIRRAYHIIKYILRATFRDKSWDRWMAFQLHNFRNTRWWGSWKGEAVWNLSELECEKKEEIAELNKVKSLQSGICPICRASLKKWSMAVSKVLLEFNFDLEELDAGYCRLIEKHRDFN